MQMMSRRGLAGLGGWLGAGAIRVRAASATTLPGCAPPGAPAPPPATIVRSESFTVTWLDRLLRIDIAHPTPVDPDVALMIRNAKPVPVYVLDGDTNFPMAVSTTRLMQWGGEVPPCLVVGISYADGDTAYRQDWRSRDLTPIADAGRNRAGTRGAYGAGPAFRRFVLQTLRPMVEHARDVDAARAVLIGHSLGGLFVLDSMTQDPAGFGNYLSVSPSLWFGNNLVLRQLGSALETGRIFPGRVAVFAGEQEERISPPDTHMTSNTLEFGRLVADHQAQFPGEVRVSIIPGATHHTILGEAMARGLRFLVAPENRRRETF